MSARIRELEALCAEVYVAAVELGLPQALLNRLWTVAAGGSAPHAYMVDIPGARPRATRASAETSSRWPTPSEVSPQSATDVRVPSAAPELEPLPQRYRVLVVDDDPMMLDVLVRILRRENFDLVTAASGEEALARAAESPSPIDLLVTDYAMPGMKGPQVAERLRERFPQLRVLYQTGFSDMLFDDRVELEQGAAFVEKPFTARGLREAARLVLTGCINPPRAA